MEIIKGVYGKKAVVLNKVQKEKVFKPEWLDRFSKQLQRKIAKMMVTSYEQLTMLRVVNIAARAKNQKD